MRVASNTLRWAVVAGLLWCGGAKAETMLQQCGSQYQSAKAAGTLNGMTWPQFRSDCTAKLKAQPASASTPAPAPTVVAAPGSTPVSNPLSPAASATTAVVPAAPAVTAGAKPSTALATGRAAFVVRERQCGTEWRANKVTLTAQTPGLTWPKYLSTCNARLKAAGK